MNPLHRNKSRRAGPELTSGCRSRQKKVRETLEKDACHAEVSHSVVPSAQSYRPSRGGIEWPKPLSGRVWDCRISANVVLKKDDPVRSCEYVETVEYANESTESTISMLRQKLTFTMKVDGDTHIRRPELAIRTRKCGRRQEPMDRKRGTE
jgi:hypothetical protein